MKITWKRANENVHASLVSRAHIPRIHFARFLFEEKWTFSYAVCPTYSFIIGRPVGPNYGLGFLRRKIKKTKRRTAHPEGVTCPTPSSIGPIFAGRGRAFQVVWRTDLEVDLERAQNYFVELLALYLRRMIIYMQYSMILLACAGAAETMPSHGPHGKSFNLLQFFSLRVIGLSLQ